MIDIKDLTLAINKKIVLKKINMTISDGEIIGIIGNAGSGKSILAKTLCGLQRGYSGKVLFDEAPLSRFRKKTKFKIVSHLQKARPGNPDETVYNFLLSSRIIHKKIFRPFSEYDYQVTEEYIKKFKLQDSAENKIYQLSDSTLKRVKLAHLMISESRVLVLDNPTSDLDVEGIGLLRKILSRYVANGKNTAVLFSNDLNFISQESDTIFLINNGETSEAGTPAIITSEFVKKYFNTDVIISRNIYNGKPEVHFFPEN